MLDVVVIGARGLSRFRDSSYSLRYDLTKSFRRSKLGASLVAGWPNIVHLPGP